jgi:penicillin-binding protein 1C
LSWGGNTLLRGGCVRLLGTVLLATLVTYAAQVGADSRLVAPSPTPIVVDRNGAFITQAGHRAGERVEYGYWITTPPDRVVRATLALEDRRFWRHPGVDPVAVARAVWQRLAGSGASGASTIAMQVARMQHPRPRTLWAKAVEAGTALALTARYGREPMLAQYFRLAPYGENSHGIGHAARWYFDRPASDLTWAQAALLASVPKAPARLSLRRVGTRVAERAGRALDALGLPRERQGLAEPGVIARPIRPAALHPVLRLERIAAQEPPGPEPILHASINLVLQAEVARAAAAQVRSWHGAGAQQAAVMVVRRHSREVLALAASVPGPGAGIDFAAVERSPGSTLKPFLYALALERGLLAPDSVLADLPEGAAGIHNADGAFLGPLLPRQALANSRNVPATNLLRRVGLQSGFAYLRALGVHVFDGSAERFGLALALGALPTRLDRLMQAYSTLAEDGMAQDLLWLEGQDRAPPRRLMSTDTARLLGRFLSDPVARLPSFPRYGSSEFPFATALKTGTSQGYRDAWTMAWSDQFLVGVWVGRPDGGPMSQLSGARAAAALAQVVLLRLHGTGRADLVAGEFAPPPGWAQAELCTSTGRPGPGCAERLLEWVRPAADRVVRETARLQIVQPDPDTHVWRNPEAPPALNRLVLRAVAEPSVSQLVWLVDGVPVATAPPSRPLNWAMQPGRHRFQVRLPLQDEASLPLTVVVE